MQRKLQIVPVPKVTSEEAGGDARVDVYDLGDTKYLLRIKSDDIDADVVQKLGRSIAKQLGVKRVMTIVTDTNTDVDLFEIEPPELRN